MSYDVGEAQRYRREYNCPGTSGKEAMKEPDRRDGDQRSGRRDENSQQYQRLFWESSEYPRPTYKYEGADRISENSPLHQRRFRESPEDPRLTNRYKEAIRKRENSPLKQCRFRETSENSRSTYRYKETNRWRENSPLHHRRFRESPENSRPSKRYKEAGRNRENSPRYQRRSRESSEDSRPSRRYKEFRTVATQTEITINQHNQQGMETLLHRQYNVTPPVEPYPSQQKMGLLELTAEGSLPVLPCLTKNQKRKQNRRTSLAKYLASGNFDEQKMLTLWKRAATSDELKLFYSHLERLRKERDSGLGEPKTPSHRGGVSSD